MSRHLRAVVAVVAVVAGALAPLIAQAQVQQQMSVPAQVKAQPVQSAQPSQSGEGKVYAPGPFDSVVVDGAGQVRLLQGDRDEVVVPGDARAQEAVEVRLDGRRLKIACPAAGNSGRTAGRGWRFVSGTGARLVIVGSNDVFAPGVFSGDHLSVSMAGMGVVRLDQLKVGQLDFEVSGAGEGQLNGRVDHLRLSVSGKGRIAAEQLRTGSAEVSISGVGNATPWAVDSLRVQISGAGHVDYWGTAGGVAIDLRFRDGRAAWGKVVKTMACVLN